tara:strand:- start:394 stop:915 length:522 start_codon:yes stop_codon:yes gene_type:complete
MRITRRQLRQIIRESLLLEQSTEFLYRASPEDYIQNLLRDGSIRSRGKDFVSISTDPDSGSMDDYGEVVMKLDRNKILSAGGVEIIYDDPDFWNEFPDIAKHVTGYAGEDDYIERGGDEEWGMDFDEMVLDYEQEAEVVIPELPAAAIVSVTSTEPLSQETLDLLTQNNIPVE